MEKYSVLMAVYKKEKPEYLIQSLDSMLAQTVLPDEIVLVEDGPLKESLYRVIRRYQKKYPSVLKVVSLPWNSGLGNALNYGLSYCSHELVARMDSDDISMPARCGMQLEAFKRQPQLSIVGTQIDEFSGSPRHVIASRVVPTSYQEILRFSRRRSPFNHPTVMFRKSAVIKAGGYAAYGRKEDLDLFVRMLQQGTLAVNLKKSYLLYRTSKENLHRRKSWQNCKEYIRIMYGFHKKGYNSMADMAYIIAGQLLICLLPDRLAKKLTDWFLRKRYPT